MFLPSSPLDTRCIFCRFQKFFIGLVTLWVKMVSLSRIVEKMFSMFQVYIHVKTDSLTKRLEGVFVCAGACFRSFACVFFNKVMVCQGVSKVAEFSGDLPPWEDKRTFRIEGGRE